MRFRYDSALQMIIEPPKQLGDINVEHLRFLRWMLIQKATLVGDGRVVGESSGELVDFLAEKAKRETETAAA